MNIQGYEKLRATLESAGVDCEISPVPGPNDDYGRVTIKFRNWLSDAPLVHDALRDSGLSCDDGARQMNDDPALRFLYANLGRIEFEDLNCAPAEKNKCNCVCHMPGVNAKHIVACC